MKLGLQPCKVAAAAVLILLLLIVGGQVQAGDVGGGGECSAVSRSKTFDGDCESKAACVDACRRELYTGGYCFLDVAVPDHRVCIELDVQVKKI
ncbi:hypothetical protein EJB05_24529, partial [Eragrostis curvula]